MSTLATYQHKKQEAQLLLRQLALR